VKKLDELLPCLIMSKKINLLDILQVYTLNESVIDGCAIFYRSDLFKAIKKYEVRNL
jgi:hypothetical protein